MQTVELTIDGESIPAAIRYNPDAKLAKYTLYVMDSPMVCQAKAVQAILESKCKKESEDVTEPAPGTPQKTDIEPAPAAKKRSLRDTLFKDEDE